MPVLDLKKYKNTAGTYSKEAAEKALAESNAKYLNKPGVYELKITEVKISKDTHGNEGKIVLSKDPAWAQFAVTLANAAGATMQQTVLFPLSDNIRYTNPQTGKESAFVYGKFVSFVHALGLDDDKLFIQALVNKPQLIDNLVGLELIGELYWSPTKIHPEYDNNSQAWFLYDGNGALICEEPFSIDKDKKGDERWIEMKKTCSAAKKDFTSNLEVTLKRNDNAKNALGCFQKVEGAKPLSKPAPESIVADVVDDTEDAF